MYSYNVVTDDGEAQSITFFDEDFKPYMASREHPMFDLLLEKIRSNASSSEIIALFDARGSILKKFKQLSKKVSINPGTSQIMFEGEVLHGVLADTIAKYHFEGNANFVPLVSFLEKIQKNPNIHSKENLYRWLT